MKQLHCYLNSRIFFLDQHCYLFLNALLGLYDQAFNNSFHQKIESLQYQYGAAITSVIRETSREKNYQELGLESL